MAEHKNGRTAIDRMAQRFVDQSQQDTRRGLRDRPMTHDEARKKTIPIAKRYDRNN